MVIPSNGAAKVLQISDMAKIFDKKNDETTHFRHFGALNHQITRTNPSECYSYEME